MTVSLLAAVLVGLVSLFVYVERTGDETLSGAELVTAENHRLSNADDGKVTLVEFLDFECPSCRQVFPLAERLRAEYDGRITYVVRHFPLPSHRNAENAARAAEAAALQGRFEPMYLKLFENQQAWGDAQDDRSETFVDYARQIGLDVDRFRSDLAGTEVERRMRTDVAAAEAAGVTGTPTFFLNGERLSTPTSYQAFKDLIDQALAAR
ncbi:thioredoxin domain-containing protein [Asanoa sp. WMMD1127]|nr:thioredoxin domain-containing protein [Asanoa sp. WMMD1127]MDG4825079.1 thioredoxin domain-containing protein [Asanoa sp. WMMD1127]